MCAKVKARRWIVYEGCARADIILGTTKPLRKASENTAQTTMDLKRDIED